MTQATFLFKLRSNIDLEGDVELARRELEALLPEVWPIRDLSEMVHRYPILGTCGAGAAVHAHTRPGEVKAYHARVPLDRLPMLVRRLSFIQTIYAILPDDIQPPALDGIEPVVSIHRDSGTMLLVATPHYALLELADVVAKRASVSHVEDALEGLLTYLLGSAPCEPEHRLIEGALTAKTTSGLLTHDLHYYKAKFFPRLARAVLNICASHVGVDSPLVLDPFVGSGTALMEAVFLGMPSIGLDIDPLSVLITQQKLRVLETDPDVYCQEADTILGIVAASQRGQLPLLMPPKLTLPNWLTRKFGEGQKYPCQELETILADIQIAQAALQSLASTSQPPFSVLLSDAIARKLRFRFLGTGVGRFSLSLARRPLIAIFTANIRSLGKTLRAWPWLRDRLELALGHAVAYQGDARGIRQTVGGPFDVVLTSPPYLPAASGRESYARSRAPSLLALGLATPTEVEDLESSAVGTMNGYLDLDTLTPRERDLVLWLHRDELRSIKAAPTSRYFLDMRQAFEEMFAVLAPGGCAAVVSGKQSTFYRFATREVLYTAESAELLAEEATLAGFEIIDAIDLALRKANKNARPRSLDDYYETILLLSKPSV